MCDAVRDLLLPLEQQALARRAADHLVTSTADLAKVNYGRPPRCTKLAATQTRRRGS